MIYIFISCNSTSIGHHVLLSHNNITCRNARVFRLNKKNGWTLSAKNFSQNQKKKVIRTILHIYAMLCFKKYAHTSVSCKVITIIEKWPNQVNLKMSKRNEFQNLMKPNIIEWNDVRLRNNFLDNATITQVILMWKCNCFSLK